MPHWNPQNGQVVFNGSNPAPVAAKCHPDCPDGLCIWVMTARAVAQAMHAHYSRQPLGSTGQPTGLTGQPPGLTEPNGSNEPSGSRGPHPVPRGTVGCARCGEDDHFVRDCPKPQDRRGQRARRKARKAEARKAAASGHGLVRPSPREVSEGPKPGSSVVSHSSHQPHIKSEAAESSGREYLPQSGGQTDVKVKVEDAESASG